MDSTYEEPRCHVELSGGLSTGGVVVAQDQMLFLARDGPDHLRNWGSGTSVRLARRG
jgi:hypothetical protein